MGTALWKNLEKTGLQPISRPWGGFKVGFRENPVGDD
jgi:hypothetical protein